MNVPVYSRGASPNSFQRRLASVGIPPSYPEVRVISGSRHVKINHLPLRNHPLYGWQSTNMCILTSIVLIVNFSITSIQWSQASVRTEVIGVNAHSSLYTFALDKFFSFCLTLTFSPGPVSSGVTALDQAKVLGGKTMGPDTSARFCLPQSSSTRVSANGNVVPMMSSRCPVSDTRFSCKF